MIRDSATMISGFIQGKTLNTVVIYPLTTIFHHTRRGVVLTQCTVVVLR